MAQERPSTPEKQLLDLIEDPKEQDLSHKKIKRSSFSLFSLAALKGRFSFLINSIKSGTFVKEILLDIKKLNKVLQVFIVLLFCFVIGNFTMTAMKIKKTPDFISKEIRSSGEGPATEFATKSVNEYLEGPRSRNIFRFGDFDIIEEKKEEEVIEEVAPPVEAALSKAEVLAQSLGLVGIGWSSDPDVMIENVGTKKMYFLKRGDRIEGLIKVEAIYKERVILTLDNGKEVELR